MNKDESLKLFNQGRNVWNVWAEDRLAEKRKLKESGEWIDDLYPDNWNDPTKAWQETATADFSGREFVADADFSDFIFPGQARFEKSDL